MTLLRGMPAVFIIAILMQSVVSLNDSVVQPTGNIEEHESPLIPEIYNLNCINITLKTDNIDMFPNSTIFVRKYDMFLNSSAYVQNNDTITICKPEWVLLFDKFTVGFYFIFIIFMIQAQIPLAFCFGTLSRLFLTFVCGMPAATLLSIGVSATYPEFIDKCVISISVLTFINVSTLGWMTFLCSNCIIGFLERRHCIEVTNNKIVLKNLCGIADMGLVLATIISLYSFLMIMFDVVHKLYGIEFIEKIDSDKMLLLFGLPIILFLIINYMLCFWKNGNYVKYAKATSHMRKELRLQHRRYFMYYAGSICMWFIGCCALTFDYWIPWYCFVIVNITLPVYWMSELQSLKNFVYEVPRNYPEQDEGYTVLFQLGKRVVKLDFDYTVTDNVG